MSNVYISLLYSTLPMNQVRAHFAHLGALMREYRFVAGLFCRHIKHRPRPIGFGIIFQLQCVAAHKILRRSHKTDKGTCVILHQGFIRRIVRIAGHYEQYRNRMLIAARCFEIISQVLEYQPFIQRSKRSRHFR